MINHDQRFHEMSQPLNQLTFMKNHCLQLIEYLNVKMEMTYLAAPKRYGNYELTRTMRRNPKHREDKLEWSIWNQWNPQSSKKDKFIKDCKSIQTYQMRLQNTRADRGWGRVDLVGVSNKFSPIVFELKEDQSKETPLRMIIEAVAYALAIRKTWNEGNLRAEWCKTVTGGSKSEKTLTELPIVGLAPSEYWTTKIGQKGKRTSGKVPDDAWKPFNQLCKMIGDRGFPVSFYQFDVGTEGDNRLIPISNVKHVKLPN